MVFGWRSGTPVQRGVDEAQMWGMLPAVVARHAPCIHGQERATAEAEAMSAIRQLFDAELDRPTDLGTIHLQN
jgi:hypothetical protein